MTTTGTGAAAQRDPKQVETLSARDLLTKQFPPENFIVNEGLLPINGLMFIAGPPKSFKSFILNSIIYHLTTGTNLFGAHRKNGNSIKAALIVPKPQRVLMFEQEIGYYDLQARLIPLASSLAATERSLFLDNFHLHSRDRDMRLDTTNGIRAIEAVIERTKPNVVCFDPLIEFHVSNENDAQEMAKVLGALDRLRDHYGFATIITHHTGKPDASGVKIGPEMMRGSSVIFGKGDAYLMISRTNAEASEVKVDFTIRRGKAISTMHLQVDWTQYTAKFVDWHRGRSRKGEESVLDLAPESLRSN